MLTAATLIMSSALLAQNSLDVNRQTLDLDHISGLEAMEKFLKGREKVEKLRHLATKENNADAQFELGLLLITGNGVPQDLVEGALSISLAASQGHVRAQVAPWSLIF